MRMAFTSGTTGNPKGVIHSHDTTLPTCRTLNADMGVSEDEVFLIYLPLGLNWGYLTLVQSVIAGARAVLLDQFSAGAALDLVERERVSFIPTAPASIIAMLNEPGLARRDLASLRVVITGGASCPLETIREYRARIRGHLIELYGMLETGFHTYTRLGDDPEAVAGTVGRPAAGMGLRLIDEQGRDVPPGGEGEIAADGPSVHLGYHKNPAANAELFTADGWFRTGDLGQLDAAGNVKIVGRLKEMINRGGKKFFPREIEEILYTHPKILHAAIVGVPDPRLGERNCLCVIPRAGQRITLEEVVAFLRDEVATYKLPERLEIVDELPFTPTGKIQRHVLARRLADRRTP
jgi:acyl-CoA synthetase (AMP-forming)/AMP-acid ligase II